MKIVYLGHSCFKIISSNNVAILTDPYTKVGYELPDPLYADIVTVSHGHFDHNYVQALSGAPAVVTSSACVKDISIAAIPTWHDPKQGSLRGANNVYLFSVDGIRICHLGDYGEADNSALIEQLKGVDVCMLPIGGKYTIDAKQAKAFVDALQPKIVIPMHYRPADGALDIADEKEFLQFFAPEIITYQKGETQLSQEDLRFDGTKIIFMERR